MFPGSTALTCTWVIQADFPTSQSLPAESTGALLLLGTRRAKQVKNAVLSRIYNGFVIVSLFHISSLSGALSVFASPVNETASIN